MEKSKCNFKETSVFKFDPDKEPAFSHKKELGNGITTYWVEDSHEGIKAVRKAVDAEWGEDENSWCLVSRDASFDEEDRDMFTEDEIDDSEDLKEAGLTYAWIYWKVYNAYQKRVAYKDGRLIGISANDYKGKLFWCDRYGSASDYLHGAFDKEGYELSGDSDDVYNDPFSPLYKS